MYSCNSKNPNGDPASAGDSYGGKRMASGASDQPTGQEHEDASDDDLKGRLQKRRVHIAVTNVADGPEFHRDYADGDAGGQTEIGNQIGKRVTETAGGGHQTGDRAADPRGAAASQRAVVGKRLGKAHGNSSADAGGQADQKR